MNTITVLQSKEGSPKNKKKKQKIKKKKVKEL